MDVCSIASRHLNPSSCRTLLSDLSKPSTTRQRCSIVACVPKETHGRATETVSHLVRIASWFFGLDEIEDERDTAIEKLNKRQDNRSVRNSSPARTFPAWPALSIARSIVSMAPIGSTGATLLSSFHSQSGSSTRPSSPSSANQRLTIF